jgi:membrane fusion protein, multidrug efflux system
MNQTKFHTMRLSLCLALCVVAACTERSADGAPAVGTAAGRGGGTGGSGGARGGGAAPGGRQSPSIVLSASDVFTVTRGTIETTTQLSGDLRPIEEIVVRARVEGDLTAVLMREGEPVRGGALLARFDTTELAVALVSAQADLAAARGETATANWNLEQSRELLKVGAISEQAFRATEQAALGARARQAAAESRLRSSELARRDAQVLAPATGTISRRFVQTGERVSRGAQLFTLVRDDTLEFTAAVPARSASVVRAGQEVRFVVDGRDFVGRVARVSPAIDPASRSVAVYVRVPNRDGSLKANAFASGRVVSSERRDVLNIPVSAIRHSRQDDEDFVYRIAGSEIGVAPVQLGGMDEAKGMVEVVSGLDENDRVVVGNVGTIGRGMKVQILNADNQSRGGGSPRGSGGSAGGDSSGGGRRGGRRGGAD